MKSRIFLFLIIQTLFSIETIFAQITFQKTFGGTGVDYGVSIQQTTDGGYIIAGTTESMGAGGFDIYLIRTDAIGDTLWTKTFGGIADDGGGSVQQTTDGGFIIMGILGVGLSNHDIYLIRTDANGDSLWTKTFGGTNTEEGHSVQQTTDGGYIITGLTLGFNGNGYDVYLIKTNTNGDSLWIKTFGGTNADEGNSVQQTTDGGYIVSGTTSSFGAGGRDIYLTRTDGNGDLLWSKTFGGTSYDEGSSVQQTTDGGYIITGNTLSFGSGNRDVYLIKTDVNGDALWTKTFGGTNDDGGWSVQQTTEGGYIITGSRSFGAGGYGVYLIKTDANGDSLWTKAFGGIGVDWGNSIKQTMDGGYIITGWADSFGTGNSDIYLIKTDSLGNSGCNEGSITTIVTSPATQVTTPSTIIYSTSTIVTTPATAVGSGGIVATLCATTNLTPNPSPKERGVGIAPNPFSNEINITSSTDELSEIILYDITSRKLLQQTFTNSTSINTSQLSKGIYIYEVGNNKEVIGKGKVVKE